MPANWLDQAKANFRISYGHTSHGGQIITGMDLLKGAPGSLYWFDHEGTQGGLSLHDRLPPGDLGILTELPGHKEPETCSNHLTMIEMLSSGPGVDRYLLPPKKILVLILAL